MHSLVVNQLLQVLAAAEFKHKVHVRVPAKHVQQLWCQRDEMEALRDKRSASAGERTVWFSLESTELCACSC